MKTNHFNIATRLFFYAAFGFSITVNLLYLFNLLNKEWVTYGQLAALIYIAVSNIYNLWQHQKIRRKGSTGSKTTIKTMPQNLSLIEKITFTFLLISWLITFVLATTWQS